jgi:hypothetical protein
MSKGGRCIGREFLDASGIACLSGSYNRQLKEKQNNHCYLLHSKVFGGDNPIKDALKGSEKRDGS